MLSPVPVRMEAFFTPLRHTVRSLRANPGYLLVSVTVLAVSIATQMAIFAVVDALLLRPPSGRAPQEFAFVRSSLPAGHVSYPDFRDLQERNSFFAITFAYATGGRASLVINDELST